jgi:transcriptional/translational regulatory protein YebC/TACO1
MSGMVIAVTPMANDQLRTRSDVKPIIRSEGHELGRANFKVRIKFSERGALYVGKIERHSRIIKLLMNYWVRYIFI